MKIFNKLISLILTLSLLLSCIMVMPASATQIPADNVLSVLEGLGFYDSKAEIDFSAPLSRAEFAKIAARLVYMGDVEAIIGDTVLPYEDVDTMTDVYAPITLLYKLGFLKGGTTHFEPFKTITPADAVEILVKIMGYNYLATNTGSYFVAAQNKGLLKRVSFESDEYLTYSDMYMLLYNTLKADVSDFNELDGNPDNGRELFIEKRHNIFRVEGLVSDIGRASIYGESQISINNIQIADIIVGASDEIKKDLLGKYVEGFYKENENGLYELIAVGVLENRNNVIEINAPYITDFSNNIYTYYIEGTDEDNTVEAQVKDNYLFVYNGKAFKSTDTFEAGMLTPQIGTVTLIDNDGDGLYDIISVYDYRTFIVGNKNTADSIIYSHIDAPMGKIDLGQKTVTYDMSNANGDAVAFADLQEYNVLLVAESLDGKNYNIKVSDKVVSGTITARGSGIVEIDGGEFKVKAPIINGDVLKFHLTPGQSAEFCLDSLGNIAFVKGSNTGDDGTYLAYICAIGVDRKGLTENLRMQLFTNQGAYAVFDAANKVKIDGINYSNADLDAMLAAVGQADQLIRFRLNDEGKISWVDTLEVGINEDESLVRIPMPETASYYIRNYAFNGDVGVSEDTIAFMIPVPFEEEELKVVKRSGIPDDTKADVKAYKIGDQPQMCADALVLKTAGSVAYTFGQRNNPFGVITKVSTVYDAEEEEESIKLTVYANGIENVIKTEKLTDINFTAQDVEGNRISGTLDVGDLITYKLDDNTKLLTAGSYTMLYDYSTDKFFSTTGSVSNWRSNYRIAREYVYNLKDGLMQTTQVHPSQIEGKTLTELNLKIYGVQISALNSTAKVMKINPVTGKVKTLTLNDIQTYLNVGTECSKVFYKSFYGTIDTIFIYEE